ncbi:hypothetical protein F4823DRAFT_572736, partial [Ustulina deusta]
RPFFAFPRSSLHTHFVSFAFVMVVVDWTVRRMGGVVSLDTKVLVVHSRPRVTHEKPPHTHTHTLSLSLSLSLTFVVFFCLSPFSFSLIFPAIIIEGEMRNYSGLSDKLDGKTTRARGSARRMSV